MVVANATIPPPYNNPLFTNVKPHSSYYFPEGNLVIQAGATLFRVWDGSFRRHSKRFCELYNLPSDPTLSCPYSDPEFPLVLNDVQPYDLERFLWIIYPSSFGQYKASTTEDWTVILHLANLWGFNDIRTLAVKELTAFEMNAVDKIVLGQTYNVERGWLFNSYTHMCSRPTPVSVDEAKRLGAETTALIAITREKLEKWGRGKPADVKKAVSEIFQMPEEH